MLLAEPRIGSYSAFLLLGLLGGYFITRWRAVRVGIPGSHIDNLTLVLAVVSLFGARFFSWWFYFPPGVSLWEALTDPRGGMVFYGGLIFGIVTVILYASFARLPLGNLMDACAPGLALGLALGRVGCFLAGCCWGDLCAGPDELAKLPSPQLTWQVHTVPFLSRADFPFAVQFPPGSGAFEQHRELNLIDEHADRSQRVHPVQLYEAALALTLCVILHLGFSRRRWHGQIFCWLVLGYALIRFPVEFLRGDNSPAYFGFTLSQIISLVLAAMAISLLLVRRTSTSLALWNPPDKNELRAEAKDL